MPFVGVATAISEAASILLEDDTISEDDLVYDYQSYDVSVSNTLI